jgi:hypothetical protein
VDWAPRPQQFCSKACRGAARDLRVDRTCEICGAGFKASRRRVQAGAARYCSMACLGVARGGPPQLRRCRLCGKEETWRPSHAKRPYCSRECYWASKGRKVERQCLRCGTPFLIGAYEIKHGLGKYCSRGCYHAACRLPRLELTCAHCHAVFHVLPCHAARRYCGRACYFAVHGALRHRCPTCRRVYRAAPSQPRTYCSHACANQGRDRARRPELARALELHAQGLKTPRIQAQLAAENPAWVLGAGAIRQLVSRVRQLPPARHSRRLPSKSVRV